MLDCRNHKTREVCVLLIIFLFVGICITVACLCLIIYHGPARHVERSYDFSYNESRLLNYSSTWCSSVSVTPTPYVDMSFYLLENLPPLKDHDEFEVTSEAFDILYDNVSYSFYLYPGSYINITTCLPDNHSADVSFFYILGEKNYMKWQHSQYTDSSLVESSFNIPYCWDTSKHQNTIITSNTADYYYMVYFKYAISQQPVWINNLLQFYRTKLVISNDNIVEEFATATDHETLYLDVSYRQTNPVVAAIAPPKSPDKDPYGENWLKVYTIHFKCQDRYILYIVIGLAVGLFCVLAAIMAAVGVYVCLCGRQGTSEALYTPINSMGSKSYETL